MRTQGYWFRLAFYKDDTLKDFVGISYVEGFGFQHALQRARDLGCNPGGAVAFEQIDQALADDIPTRNKNRLIPRAEIDAIFNDAA